MAGGSVIENARGEVSDEVGAGGIDAEGVVVAMVSVAGGGTFIGARS